MFLANNIADILSDWPTAVNIVIGFQSLCAVGKCMQNVGNTIKLIITKNERM